MYDRVQKAMEKVCDQYGGPRQFLQQTYNTPELRAEFYRKLIEDVLPPREDMDYHDEKALKISDPDGVSQIASPMAVHPSFLSFQDISSVKGHPERHVCLKITEQVVRDGFISNQDNLVVTKNSMIERIGTFTPVDTSMGLGSVGYIKGSARACTLLCICALFIEEETSLKESLPVLYESARVVFAIGVTVVDRQSAMQMTFKRSIRGAIREAPNIITWIITLTNLRVHDGSDPLRVIKKWNSDSAPSDRLVGQKATSVQMVLERMPESVAKLVMDHVSRYGWQNCMISDETLASKKIPKAMPSSLGPWDRGAVRGRMGGRRKTGRMERVLKGNRRRKSKTTRGLWERLGVSVFSNFPASRLGRQGSHMLQ